MGEGEGGLIPSLEGGGGELVEEPLLVAWSGSFAWGSRGLDGNHGLVPGACDEGVSGV